MEETSKPKLNQVERLILRNQYAILEFLTRAHPEFAQIGNVVYHDADTYRRYQTLLENGYELLLNEILESVYEIDLSYEEQREILDILQMYEDLQHSFDQLEDKGAIKERDVEFPGWDGNSPKGELWFARLFCYRGEDEFASEKQNRPDRFAQVRPSPAYNGHGSWGDSYKRMLRVYQPLRRNSEWSRTLTSQELQEVLDAFPHPESPRGREIRLKKLE